MFRKVIVLTLILNLVVNSHASGDERPPKMIREESEKRSVAKRILYDEETVDGLPSPVEIECEAEGEPAPV